MSYFQHINKIAYEGPNSTNPLAYRYYDAKKTVRGKTMAEHLRIAVCYWHSFCSNGSDVFGVGTFDRPWLANNSMEMAEKKLENAFDFFERLGTPYFTFHDRDIAPEGSTLQESNKNLDILVEKAMRQMQRTGVKLLWGTAQLFVQPRYMGGAATNPDPEVFTYAAAQVKHVLEATHRMGGENYVLWGGREGYETLLNTDMKRELDQLGRFLNLVVEHKHKIGFKGAILIEPKPKEPSKHQYDFDCATVYGFLRHYGLEKEVKVNIEVNHATLSGHTFDHEIAFSMANNIFGSIDINRGDLLLGWDTDQFPNSIEESTLAMYQILKGGGFTTGGMNFDAKVRRQSIDAEDMFHAHVGGIDTLAKGLLIASKMLDDGAIDGFVQNRYKGWQGQLGQDIMNKKLTLADLSDYTLKNNLNPKHQSGRQELLENVLNSYLFSESPIALNQKTSKKAA